ncbi:MAG: hypothetical protein M5U01_33020 [Ardenticatenaceae bacterium]|nr:hypothetical protein [Ardenticatenaceae bacterium]HBY99588.1 hypothetical protein [Chloroflexota bacterium]
MFRPDRTVKHFSLHRIARTELRLVSDVEAGVLPVLQEEEAVIRGYAQRGGWPHRWVTLFVLQDLQPLLRQLRPGSELPPGAAEAMDQPPVVNVYDLADLSQCHVFVNHQAMVAAGYWSDALAIRALLAHEHAHPLAENETARASRSVRVELSLPARDDHSLGADRRARTHHLLNLLADKLCLRAPREVFTNELTIRSGFGEPLLYLDRRNVANAAESVTGRAGLRRQLQQEVARGQLTPAGADLLLLIGDLKGSLELALEVAPFYRAGREADARELEAVLNTAVFPHLEPEVLPAYTALCHQYVALRSKLTAAELEAWAHGVLNILADALAEKGLPLRYRLQMATV